MLLNWSDKKTKILILFAGIFILLFCGAKNIFADDSTDCDNLTGDAKDECQNLNKKAKIYQELIDIKNKQQDTLQNQLDTIDKEQQMNQLQISSTQKQINDLDKRINELEKNILDKEADLEYQKKFLVGLLQSYYEYDQQGVLDIVLASKDFSDTINQKDYLEQSGVKLSDVVKAIQDDRDGMLNDRNELNQKREDINNKKEDLADKNADLQFSENQKNSLLQKTQGEEQKYQDLLAHVEEQKRELFNFSDASNLGEVSASVSKYAKPSSNLASTSWYFSQKDSRWGNKRIGNSSSLMKDYGCAVTSVSMVFRKKGSSIDPGRMAGQKIFYYDLIKWPTTWSPGISLTSSIGHGNIKWSTIDSEIGKGNPVIVYIGKTNGGGGHYVVITGKDSKDYIVHDPYFGPNLYLGTSKALVGKIGRDSGVKVDQMIIYH